MDKDGMMKKIMGGLLIGGLLLGGSGLALAASDTTEQSTAQQFFRGPSFKRTGIINPEISQSVLDELVSKGTLSQEQADKIIALAEQKETERETRRTEMANMTMEERQAERQEIREDRVGIWEQLLDDNTITQEQLDAIRDGIQSERHEQRQADLEEALKALVDKGVINNDEAAAIKSKLAAFEDERQAQMQARAGMSAAERQAETDKIRNMNAQERRAYMQANRPDSNPLDQLVIEGTLTHSQAQQLRQALNPDLGDKGMKGGAGHMKGGMMERQSLGNGINQ
ncbi:MAG: hypothetical protein ABRQ23_10620 [Syntrophomonadaceae bacterium]